jgi:hypothetical protein
MKNFLIIITLIITTQFLGQVNVGPEIDVQKKPALFEEGQLNHLKQTQTYFVYQNNDDKELFQRTFNSVWKITPINLISYREYTELKLDNTVSVFAIESIIKEKTSETSGTVINYKFYLTLFSQIDGRKLHYARFELYGDYNVGSKLSEVYSKKDDSKANEFLYSEKAMFYNWSVGHLKNALQLINNQLEKSQELWLFRSESLASITELKTKILYIPDYTLNIKYEDESTLKAYAKHIDKIMGSYPYEYKIVSQNELDKLILSNKTIFYLTYVKSSGEKFVSVINSLSGEVLYTNYTASLLSTGLKSEDIKVLLKSLK